MALSVWSKHDAGHRRDVCLVEQDVCCFLTVATDAAHIGKRVERARWWIARETEFVESGQEQVATGTARERRAELERSAVVSELDLRARSARATFTLRLSATEPLERDVLPGLEENERLARRSFEVGELSLPDLLVIRREFVDTRLQYIDALAEAAVASIDWQMAAGVLR